MRSTRFPLLFTFGSLTLGALAVVACIGDDASDLSSTNDDASGGDAANNADGSGGDGGGSDGSTSIPSLTVSLEGQASGGKVTSAPAGIDCGSACTATYAVGTAVTLTAAPAANNSLVGWTKDGASCGSNSTCAVTMSGPKNVGALFAGTKSAGWVEAVSSTGSDADTHAVLDKDGNIIFATNYGGAFTFRGTSYSAGNNIFVAKLSPAGEVIWAKTFGAQSGGGISGVAVGKTGDVAIAGVAGVESIDFGNGKTITTDGEDPFVVKFSGADGTALWAKVITASENDGPGLGAVAMDGTGNVIITGHFNTSANFNDGSATITVSNGEQAAFLAKYASADGSTTNNGWKRVLPGESYVYGKKIVVDSTNDFVVGGYFGGTVDLDPGVANATLTAGGTYDGFVAKFQNVNGSLVWQKQIGAGGDDEVAGIALVDTTSNDIAVVARYAVTNGVAPSFAGTAMSTPSASGTDVAIGRLTSGTGGVQWAKRYGGAGSDYAYDITVLGPDSYAITGYSTADISFDSEPAITFSGTGGDGWFAVLSGSGAPTASWAFKAASGGLDTGQVVLGRGKNLYGFGKFIGDANVLGKTLSNAGSYDAYLFGAVIP